VKLAAWPEAALPVDLHRRRRRSRGWRWFPPAMAPLPPLP